MSAPPAHRVIRDGAGAIRGSANEGDTASAPFTVRVISPAGEEVASHDRATWADALILARAKILKAAPGAEPTTVIYADGKALAGFRWDSETRQIVRYLGPAEVRQP